MVVKTVVVAMSGGVDSSVAANILLEQGYRVLGAHLILHDEMQNVEGCSTPNSVHDVQKVCQQLGIDLHIIDLREKFKNEIMSYFIEEYNRGRTPNPCVKCNQIIKFGALLDVVIKLGGDFLATGHYARVWLDQATSKYVLAQAMVKNKDQSYVLYHLRQDQLQKIIFPLGEYEKKAVRKRAEEIGLLVHDKPESQEICFVPDNNYIRFIREKSNAIFKRGEFRDLAGNVLGEHQGVQFYTIGQRKGLGIALGYPVFVVAIDAVRNIVYLGSNQDVFAEALVAEDINWIDGEAREVGQSIKVLAKIRSAAVMRPAMVEVIANDRVRVSFAEAERAVTPGQTVTFYDECGLVLGGGLIVNAESKGSANNG